MVLVWVAPCKQNNIRKRMRENNPIYHGCVHVMIVYEAAVAAAVGGVAEYNDEYEVWGLMEDGM